METIHKVKDRENGCPFGAKCDTCNLYAPLYHTGQNGEVTAEYNCQFNNIATLTDELKNRTKGVQSAVESRINALMTLAASAQRKSLNGKDERLIGKS